MRLDSSTSKFESLSMRLVSMYKMDLQYQTLILFTKSTDFMY